MRSNKKIKAKIEKLYKKLAKQIYYRDHDPTGSYDEYTKEIKYILGKIKALEWALNVSSK